MTNGVHRSICAFKSRVLANIPFALCLFALCQSSSAQALQTIDFGSAPVRTSAPPSQTVTFTFAGLWAQPTFSLRYAIDFQQGSISCNSNWTSCQVSITFSPQYPGNRQDGLVATDGQGTVIATAYLYGRGTGPQVAFSPGTITTFPTSPPPAIYSVAGVVADETGAIYFSDNNKYLIEKLTPGSTTPVPIAGLAGGYYPSGDGGPATEAATGPINHLSIDATGNLYLASVNTVRKIDAATGIITTIAGGGSALLHGDGLPATSVYFPGIYAIALDRTGNLYISESDDIRKVDAATGIVSTVVTTLTQSFLEAQSLAIDSSGNLYFLDANEVREQDSKTGVITTVAGNVPPGYSGDGGPATQALLSYPSSLAFDAQDNLYIADEGCIRKVDSVSHNISTVAGTPNGGVAEDGLSSDFPQLQLLNSIAFDTSGDMFVGAQFFPLMKFQFSAPTLLFDSPGTFEAAPVRMFSLSNIGNEPLKLTSGSIAGPFQFQSGTGPECVFPETVAARSSCLVSIAYMLGQNALFGGIFIVEDNALNLAGTEQQVPLAVAYPQAIVSPNLGDFGIEMLGGSQDTETFSISNGGKVPLQVHSVTFAGPNPGDFSLSTNNCSSVNIQGRCNFAVTFKPQGAGNRSASLIITSNASNYPETLLLTGFATAPGFPTSNPPGVNFGKQAASSISAGVKHGLTTFDLDGDGKTDYAVWRPLTGTWFVMPSANASVPVSKQWGLDGDVPVNGDFDADGKADYAVWRPSNGSWYVIPSSDPSSPVETQWGLPGDIPLPGDFDGDGKTDYAVWRPSNGTWYVIPSSNPGSPLLQQLGLEGDWPLR